MSNYKEYMQTEKGKAARKRAQEKLKEKGYFKERMKKKRQEARDKGLCTVCLKRPVEENKSRCRECRERANKYLRKVRGE